MNEPYVKRGATTPLPLTLSATDRGCAASFGLARVGAGVMDLHYQSVRTVPLVLGRLLPSALEQHLEVWLVTGTGHHTERAGKCR